jgi:hypothetical protein
MQEYEKIGNKKNFNEIINRVKKLEKYKVELDSFYSEENKIFRLTHFSSDAGEITFQFHDFYGLDARVDMKHYLEGKRYNLDLWFEYDIVDFESLEAAYIGMKEIKKIIDDVIDGGNKDE